MMNERDWLIWAAGFFDGEGCVNIGRALQKNTGSTDVEYWRYNLTLAIANRVETPLRQFYERFGGHIYDYRQKGITYWRWSQWGKGARLALIDMLPYLQIKRPVAEVGIRFQETIWKQMEAHPKFKNNPYPKDFIAAREAMFHEARILNAKGRTNNRAPKYEGPRVLAAERAVNEE